MYVYLNYWRSENKNVWILICACLISFYSNRDIEGKSSTLGSIYDGAVGQLVRYRCVSRFMLGLWADRGQLLLGYWKRLKSLLDQILHTGKWLLFYACWWLSACRTKPSSCESYSDRTEAHLPWDLKCACNTIMSDHLAKWFPELRRCVLHICPQLAESRFNTNWPFSQSGWESSFLMFDKHQLHKVWLIKAAVASVLPNTANLLNPTHIF